MLRHFELFLACRYLKKKRLAFFSIAAVALSVAMLIVVSSVTGGFVKQLNSACHDFSGDIIVRADSLLGFPGYDELIAEALKLDTVRAATPVIKQFGMFRIKQKQFKPFVTGVNIVGIEPKSYSKITKFKQSLYKQSKRPGPPNFDIPKEYADIPRLAGACIVGVEVPYNRGPDGNYERNESLYNTDIILITVALRHTSGLLSDMDVQRKLLLIDDSETSTPFDEQTVYIPFSLAQEMCRMVEYRDDDTGQVEPARASQVLIGAEDGVDLRKLRSDIQKIWDDIATAKGYRDSQVIFETWDEQEGGMSRVIGQLERDRALLTILFSIMGVVSVFLIFCIFFVIVSEKIPDIGIVKSIGGSSGAVGRIFFVYAGAVGVVGAFLGLAMAWPFVLHINTIHEWISHTFDWRIYDPSVLLFPSIPNEVDWHATTIIIIAAVLGSLIGSMIPAARAALMKPIQALRYE